MSLSAPLMLLVIDQDSTAADLLNSTLDPTHYHLHTVTSLNQALTTSPTWYPDVIVVYIMRASSAGASLCRDIQSHFSAPILVLAGISDPQSTAHWLDAGADDLLIRPFSFRVLVAHLHKLTRRSVRSGIYPS